MPAGGETTSVVSVGDILLGDAAKPLLKAKGYDWPFDGVRPLLAKADLVIGNLEGPITATELKISQGKKYSYKVSAASGPALKRAGFHALSLANNHTLDYTVAGMRDTIANLRANGIAPFGAGENEREARRGLVYDFGTLRIGLLGYGEPWKETEGLGWEATGESPGCALLSEQNLAEDIARLRRFADIIVVSVHWGKNYQDVTNAQRQFGRRAIELGADIVNGHHPHVAQGIEVYQGKPIIYSLGNFVFGTRGRFPAGEQGYGLVSRWLFEGKKLKWMLHTPIAVNNKIVGFQPQRATPEAARQALMTHLKQYDTQVRWQGDTAYMGFGQDWQMAALPGIGTSGTAKTGIKSD